eukprot:scaffold701402_cov55-Attheya_sp.AAC.2
MVVIKSPDSNPKIISSDHELVDGLEDGDELTLVPGLSHEENKDMTYVLKTGTCAMREVELERENVTYNLQKMNCLMVIKWAHMDSNNLALVTGHNLLLDMNTNISTVVEEESDYDYEVKNQSVAALSLPVRVGIPPPILGQRLELWMQDYTHTYWPNKSRWLLPFEVILGMGNDSTSNHVNDIHYSNQQDENTSSFFRLAIA